MEHLRSALVGLIPAAIVSAVVLTFGLGVLPATGFTIITAIVGLLTLQVLRKRAKNRVVDPAWVITRLESCLEEGGLIRTASLGRAPEDPTVNLRLLDWRLRIRRALEPYPNWRRAVEEAGSGAVTTPEQIEAQNKALNSIIDALCAEHGDPE